MIIDKRKAVRRAKGKESPYLIERSIHYAEFSVVFPERFNFIKPVDTAVLSLIPEIDPDRTIHLNELLRTNKPEQQNNTFRFLTPKTPGKTEDHTPIQTRILTEKLNFKEKEKHNPHDDTKS